MDSDFVSPAWSSTAWSTWLLFCSLTYEESSVHTVGGGWRLNSLEQDAFTLAELVSNGFPVGLLFGQRDGGEQVWFCVVYKRVGYPIWQASFSFPVVSVVLLIEMSLFVPRHGQGTVEHGRRRSKRRKGSLQLLLVSPGQIDSSTSISLSIVTARLRVLLRRRESSQGQARKCLGREQRPLACRI